MNEWEDIAFVDPERDHEYLDTLLANGPAELKGVLGQGLKRSADPSRAVRGMVRFLERSFDPSTQRALMANAPSYCEMLITLFENSAFLEDILCRNPEYASWLWDEANLESPVDLDSQQSELLRLIFRKTEFQDRRAALRRFTRRELLRIATREVWKRAPLPSVVLDLSNLADAAIACALAIARAEVEPLYGMPPGYHPDAYPFSVLALGKLGGRELNFSSDIDLIFLYAERGESSGGSQGKLEHEEYFRKLGEWIIRVLSEPTPDGIAYRVDMRLRPFGRSGPLCSVVDDAVDYYAVYGRAWERQALIKARVCAGNLGLGQTLLDRLRSFIYPRYFDDVTLEEIRQIKAQSEARVRRAGVSGREVKHGEGGIRDIEFTVQLLQLLNGGKWPDLRTPNTLEAIRALGTRQYLSPFEAERLATHYVFLRQLEHRLQIENGLQEHTLPEPGASLDSLGRRMGFLNGQALLTVFRQRTTEVREILQRFLSEKGAGNLWVAALLERGADATDGLARLAQWGFSDPERARAILQNMANGPEDKPFTRDTAQRFVTVAPALIQALAEEGDPDIVLERLESMLSHVPTPGAMYSLLAYYPGLSSRLVTLAANSPWLCELVSRDVSLLDTVGSPQLTARASTRQDLEEELRMLRSAARPDAAPYRLKLGELLKVAVRDLAQGISVADVGDELTQLAEVVLDYVVSISREEVENRFGRHEAPFAVLALGKFGGREMGYASDLDLVFVHGGAAQDARLSATEYYAVLAAGIIRRLKEPTRWGALYDVDARLRPDGNKGMLVVSADRFFEYYRREAQMWERLALMKVRAVAGDKDFAETLAENARKLAFGLGISKDDVDHVEQLRDRAIASAAPRDIKRRPGGLADVELAVRLMQLYHHNDCPEVRHWGVLRAIGTLEQHELEPRTDLEALREDYLFLRRLLNRLRVARGSSTSELPEEAERLYLARRLRLAGDPLDLAFEKMTRVTPITERMLARIRERAG
ncbi:MAG TPA: bifunctional [glutamate--ammonia ligase]-adenylyl-L-tyrosine phosphorylase/[glutamate--ammonia-ligase] adenylyltransferase [Candidatus Hydrogenedentes bacterium]|nr:bifunctional [glutamate--ammonia ligase]-adenylyl-L-tyrosine phosphorylase/[glutamate--ammonia-ligase] adenylyltransferase [Candidatus Hydrogenedentota bacterium]